MTYGDFESRMEFITHEDEFWDHQDSFSKCLNDTGIYVVNEDVVEFTRSSSQEEFDKLVFILLEDKGKTTSEYNEIDRVIISSKDEEFLERLQDYKLRNIERFI